MNQDSVKWLSFSLASLALHGLAGAGLYAANQGRALPSVQAYSHTLSLGMRAASSGTTAAVKNFIPASTQVKKKYQAQKKSTKPRQQPSKNWAKTTPYATPTKHLHELKQSPQEKPFEQSNPDQLAQTALKTDSGFSGINGNLNHNSQTEQTGKHTQAGASSLTYNYDADVLRKFSSYKKYPQKLRQRRLLAKVELSFEIDRKGRVLNHAPVTNSGHRYFLSAALLQLRRAQPFPPAPETTDWRRRHYKVTINYSVNQI